MSNFMAMMIEKECDKNGVEAGKAKYRAYFLGPQTKKLYGRYQAATDILLIQDGYEDCIVTE